MITTNLKNEMMGNTPDACRKITQELGSFQVLEHLKDVSVTYGGAASAYFASEMNVHKRQVIYNLDGSNGVILQAGAMQMMLGNITAATDVSGVGDLAKKMFASKATGESAIKPKYTGAGVLVLEPTYKHIALIDVTAWGPAGMVIDDGAFLACDANLKLSVAARQNISSALAGGEGLFNTCITGNGVAALELDTDLSELVEIVLDNDVVKIDGNMAVAWSGSLQFTTERTTKSLIGSAASGEGLVNVYRGTGKILVAVV